MTKTHTDGATNSRTLSLAVRRILHSPIRLPVMLTLAGVALCGAAAQADQLEEVTVTATRRNTNTEDIPYSISVVSEKTLEDTQSRHFLERSDEANCRRDVRRPGSP